MFAGAFVLLYVALLISNKGHELPMQLQQPDTERSFAVAIFGATGTIGDGLLKAAMDNPSVTKILVVTRRPSPRIEEGVASGKVEMTIHKDYLDYTAIEEKFADVDAVFWAIGLSAVGLDQDTYREIHSEFPLRFVKSWLNSTERENLSFHYVSGSGADAGSRMMWAKEKAFAEAELARLARQTNLRVISYRPAFIRPTDAEVHLGHKVMHAIFGPIGISVAAESIGAAMIETTKSGTSIANGTIFENRDILALSETYEGETQ